MNKEEVRAVLTPQAQEWFDDIVLIRVLGASRHIRMIGEMFREIARDGVERRLTAAEMVDRVLRVAAFFRDTRGEASQAIANAIRLMTRGVADQRGQAPEAAARFILERCAEYERTAEGWLGVIKECGWNILRGRRRVLVYDYSSTVDALLEAAEAHGWALECLIPESRSLDGGRAYVASALKHGHRPVFFPDCALLYYVRQADLALSGAETFHPDGSALNTIGTELLARLCKAEGVPFYIPTPLIKVNLRGLRGDFKGEIVNDLGHLLAADWPPELTARTDFSCPELDRVPAECVTGYITEEGVIPGTQMFGVSREYARRLEGEERL